MTGAGLDSDVQNHVETSPNGRYIRYKSVLGKGAYKTVYKAFDTEEALEVAWNKLHVDRLSEHDLEKVTTEVSLLRQVEHKNIIHFYDTWRGTDANGNKTINFITEQMMSGTLKEYLKKAKAIKLKVIRRWCCNILEAIDYLHSQNPPIMHRDLKCDNIFINGHVGEVKIGDLGLSGVKEREKADSVIGTPEFMAPELYEESYTEKVDIYAFGMCLLEIVSMEYPYSECNNMAQIFKKVFSGEKPHAFGMLVDGNVKDVIAACLQREARRPSASDLLKHPLFSKWEEDDGSVSNLSLVKGVPDIVTSPSEAAPSSVEMPMMPIGTDVIDWSDPLKRNVLVSMVGVHHTDGEEQQQEISVVASRENGGFYIGLEIPIRDAVKRVEFTFDPFEDSSEQIAQDMVAEFGLGDEQLSVIREEIDHRVRAAKNYREAASRNATPQPAPRDSDQTSNSSSAAANSSSAVPTATRSPQLSSPQQSWRNPSSGQWDQSDDVLMNDVHTAQNLSKPNERNLESDVGNHNHVSVAPYQDGHIELQNVVDDGRIAAGETLSADAPSQPHVAQSADILVPPKGLLLTSSFMSSHPASSASVDTPTGALSPATGQQMNPPIAGVSSQIAHGTSLGSGVTVGPDEAVSSAEPEKGQGGVTEEPLFRGIELSQTDEHDVPALAVRREMPLSETKESHVHRIDFQYEGVQDGPPPRTQSQFGPSASSNVLLGKDRSIESERNATLHIRQSSSADRLPPGSNTPTEIFSRPVTLPPVYGQTGSALDNTRLHPTKSLPLKATIPTDLHSNEAGPPAAPENVSHGREVPEGEKMAGKYEQSVFVRRSTSGNMPKIVVVGSKGGSNDPPARPSEELPLQPLPSFPSESSGVLAAGDEETSFPRHGSLGPDPLAHGGQASAHSMETGDLVRNNSSSSQQRSPTGKSGTFRTNSWKSVQSDDSGNNIVPKLPVGKIIGDEHDQKYYTTCLKLMDHCARGRLEEVRKKLSEGAIPRFTDYDKRTPLHLASAEGHADVCALLLDCGARIMARDRWAHTPLADAIENGHLEVQNLLKSRGAVDEKQTDAEHLDMELMRYSALGDLEAVRSRTVAGANVNYADYDQRTPLHLACCEGHLEVAELLLLNGAPPDVKDRKGRSPVDDAVNNGHREILRTLRQYGAVIPKHLFEAQPELENQKGLDLGEHAAKGRVNAVRQSLEQGANPNFENYDRRTALHLACVEGRLDVVRVLLSAGAKLNARDRWGSTPADEAKKGGFNSILDELCVWEAKKKQRQVPIVSFDSNTMVMNGHDRSVVSPNDAESAHFNQHTHGIASSVSMGAIPSLPLSADEFANNPSSVGETVSQKLDKMSCISLPQTSFDRSGDLTEASNIAHEEMLLRQAYLAEKQRLEEQHQKALEGIQRKKSVESMKSARNSFDGTHLVTVVPKNSGDMRDSGSRLSIVHVRSSDSSDGRVTNPSTSFSNGFDDYHSEALRPLVSHPSSATFQTHHEHKERVRGDSALHREGSSGGPVNADIRTLVDNLIDVASTQR